MNHAIFRAYDVRGVADRDLDTPLVTDLGRAYGTIIRRGGGSRVCLGRDCRTHGPRLFSAFAAGVMSTGVDVIDVGVVASPLLYFSVFHYDADGGVQITGSHNPADYNGFKMMQGRSSMHGAQIVELRELIVSQRFAVGEGSLVERPIFDHYIADVATRLDLGAEPGRLKVVIDGGNGTGGPPALALLERLGVEVIGLHVEMDGTFPNHHPDPTVERNLQDLKDAVAAHGADIGFAYDGDADRIGVIDDQGQVIWGDRLMILLAREVLRQHPGAAIVGEVKCSNTLYADITAHGGRAIMSRVGHSIIKERMKAEDAKLGGEMSGHIFFRDRWYGFDDAVYVSGRVLEILSHAGRPLSTLLQDVPTTEVTPEIRLDCPDRHKFAVVEQAVAHFKKTHPVVDIDGARIDFGAGWGLIRASNTQPVIVLRAEADDAATLAEIRHTLERFVADTTARL